MTHSLLLKTGAIALLLFYFSQCSGSPSNLTEQQNSGQRETTIDNVSRDPQLPVTSFKEVWAYVVAGREDALKANLPLTDIGYFSAEIDTYGKLTAIPKRSAISFPGRVHLVVKCDSRSLTYFALRPGSEERQALINDLLAATRDYDGLQIDLELVPQRSGSAFLSFLEELRRRLPSGKMFTICLPARTRKIADDVYDYEKIKPLVDRILVMAYDEHWSGSRPGSVASMDWCRRVADYSLRAIGSEKLIMGLPFYGRAWGNQTTSRALIHTTTEGIIKDNNVTEIRYEDGIPTFDYDINVSVKVYYENEYSLSTRMNMYKSMNVRSIGFWRLGQETAEVWKYLTN